MDVIPEQKQEIETQQKFEIEEVIRNLLDKSESEIEDSQDKSEDSKIETSKEKKIKIISADDNHLFLGQTFKIIKNNDDVLILTETKCPFNSKKITEYLIIGILLLMFFLMLYIYGFDMFSLLRWISIFYLFSIAIKLFI